MKITAFKEGNTMKELVVKIVNDIDPESLNFPVMISGLPGCALVGKIAADHLIRQGESQLIAEIYGPTLPHHVFVENGLLRLPRLRVHHVKSFDAGNQKKDFLVITGDAQCQTIEGQYELSTKIIEIAQKYKVKEIWTLGGFAIGIPLTRKPRVFTTTTSEELLKKVLKEENTKETNGPVVGANGLVLGVGKLNGMDGGCLLGETPGFMPDPIASKEILNVLGKIQGVEWDLSNLDELAKKAVEKAKKMAGVWEEKAPGEEGVPGTPQEQPSYFG